uniref:Uncharacterized protein n=1 Tax=Cacopsylla melanoneura TaxID=428564 RepID=A0A8D8QII6_9HEMI
MFSPIILSPSLSLTPTCHGTQTLCLWLVSRLSYKCVTRIRNLFETKPSFVNRPPRNICPVCYIQTPPPPSSPSTPPGLSPIWDHPVSTVTTWDYRTLPARSLRAHPICYPGMLLSGYSITVRMVLGTNHLHHQSPAGTLGNINLLKI